MSANQLMQAALLGAAYEGAGNSGTTNLNAAATYCAVSFVADFFDATKVVSSAQFKCAITGTLGAGDLACDLYSDSNGIPGTLIETSTTWSNSGGFTVFTGFTSTSTVTRGSRYWFVLRNLNATPATNYPGYTRYYSLGQAYIGASYGSWGWAWTTSTDSGGTWPTANYTSAIFGLRVGYTDGSYAGMSITSYGASNYIYSAREVGGVFTNYSNATINIAGISFIVRKTGTPAGSLRYRLYNNTTLLGTTEAAPVGNVYTSNMKLPLYFPSVVQIPAGAPLRAVACETTNSDTVSNAYSVPSATIENSVAAKSLLPFNGTLKLTIFDDTSWTNTDTQFPHFTLLPDTSGEFAASGGVGGVSRGRLLNSGGF